MRLRSVLQLRTVCALHESGDRDLTYLRHPYSMDLERSSASMYVRPYISVVVTVVTIKRKPMILAQSVIT